MSDSRVDGGIRVLGLDGQSATLVGNEVFGGNILVKRNRIAAVAGNALERGDIRVNRNGKADVGENLESTGDVTCFNNDRLDSFFNNAGGVENCR